MSESATLRLQRVETPHSRRPLPRETLGPPGLATIISSERSPRTPRGWRMPKPACSAAMESYFASLEEAPARAYKVAERTRDREKALDTGVRVGLAVLTEGILVAPLDGITDVKIRAGPDGEHVAVFYSSPIASSGGTALAMSVLIADLVRRDLGIGAFHPTDAEVERWKEEVPLYRQ